VFYKVEVMEIRHGQRITHRRIREGNEENTNRSGKWEGEGRREGGKEERREGKREWGGT
jgi:ribosomal protein L19E